MYGVSKPQTQQTTHNQVSHIISYTYTADDVTAETHNKAEKHRQAQKHKDTGKRTSAQVSKVC